MTGFGHKTAKTAKTAKTRYWPPSSRLTLGMTRFCTENGRFGSKMAVLAVNKTISRHRIRLQMAVYQLVGSGFRHFSHFINKLPCFRSFLHFSLKDTGIFCTKISRSWAYLS